MRPRLHIATSTLAVLCSFVLVGLLGLYLKMSFLQDQWLSVARFLGESSADQVTALQRLGFYSSDIAVNLILLPIIGTIVASLVFRKHRAGAATIIAACMTVLLFYELRAQADVGQYVSRAFLFDSVRFGISNPNTASDYVTIASIVKLVLVFGLLIVIWLIARFAARWADRGLTRRARACNWLLGVPAIALFAAAVLAMPIGLTHRLHGSLLNASSTGRVASALFASGVNNGMARMNFGEALEAMRKLTNTPAFDKNNSFFGSERNDNVVVFIMETGPAQAFDLKALAGKLPGVGQLVQHAFVAEKQYTTYPYTSNAVYSILSGLYPQGRRRLLADLKNPSLDGVMTAVAPDVSLRGVYMPSLYLSEVDDQMYKAFGANDLYVADQHSDGALRNLAERRADALIMQLMHEGSKFDKAAYNLLHSRLVLDFQALEKLKVDVTAAAESHKRFFVVFQPQVAHGPWIALHNEPTVLQRGHDLMLLEDQWLGEIVDTLRSHGQLDHTIVVFTADHGIRTRAEDPALPVGRISDYMFRVPLLIFAPKSLEHPYFINFPTSHIDIAPTILALLGMGTEISQMEGVPIWQRTMNDRLYFWAGDYGGVDGFEQDGTYYMRQELSGAEFRSGYPGFLDGFPESTLIGNGDKQLGYVSSALSKADTLQEAIVSGWIRSKQVRAR